MLDKRHTAKEVVMLIAVVMVSTGFYQEEGWEYKNIAEDRIYIAIDAAVVEERDTP
jgi:hypothetical protein